jgi:hypothetical protein
MSHPTRAPATPLALLLLLLAACRPGTGAVTPPPDGPPAEEADAGRVKDTDVEPDAGVVADGDAGVPDAGRPDAGGGKPDAGPPPPKVYPEACREDIYGDGQLQTFEVQISPEAWAALQHEHATGKENDENDLPTESYHPVLSFKHGDRVRQGGTMVRLRGNPNWWSDQDKMQLQFSFNETSPDGRFRGLRKVVLDSAHYNTSMMRERLAFSVMRDLGMPAPCVNHARLVVNGQFYALYSNIEKVDREFLERNFALPDGNLYKKGKEQKTNEDTAPDTARSKAFWDADTAREMNLVGDVDQWIRFWAVDAFFPNADGYWAGGLNYYTYDHPEQGFLFLPWDVDLSFDNLGPTIDPYLWHKQNRNFHGRPHFDAVLETAEGKRKYVEALAWVRKNGWDVKELQGRMDRWAAQIDASAREDVHAPWTYSQHKAMVRRLREHVAARARFMDDWLACQQRHMADGGTPVFYRTVTREVPADGGTGGGTPADGGTPDGGGAVDPDGGTPPADAGTPDAGTVTVTERVPACP